MGSIPRTSRHRAKRPSNIGDRGVMEMYDHFLLHYPPTKGVWWQKMVIILQETDLRKACGGNVCPFPVILLTYNRCVVGRNGHNMTRN